MKVRIYPQTSEVKSILQERINEARNLNAEDESELAKITNGGLLLPGNEEYLKRAISSRTEYIKSVELQSNLLDSHEALQVAVEIEL